MIPPKTILPNEASPSPSKQLAKQNKYQKCIELGVTYLLLSDGRQVSEGMDKVQVPLIFTQLS